MDYTKDKTGRSSSAPVYLYLADVSDIFYFFCSGRRKGGSEAAGRGGGDFFIENPREGGGLQERDGAEGPKGCLRRIGDWGGGGLNIFFGPKCPPSLPGVAIPTKKGIPEKKPTMLYVCLQKKFCRAEAMNGKSWPRLQPYD